MLPLLDGEVFGLVRPTGDAHTLGVNHLAELLESAGYRVEIADRSVTDAAERAEHPEDFARLCGWLASRGITRLGVSYRLDPQQARSFFGRLHHQLREAGHLREGTGRLRGLYFAGLPQACDLVAKDHADGVRVFHGGEDPVETLVRLGVPPRRIPPDMTQSSPYDDQRIAFAEGVIERAEYLSIGPEDRSGYASFGTRSDHLSHRVTFAADRGQSPLMRVHVGPFGPDRDQAVGEFIGWVRRLAASGLLDVLSIGTSQLTQEMFGQDWQERPNGGGVPINSPGEYAQIWQAARPMLVRTYAGTSRVDELARIHERELNIAWHALSFWWFSRIDGRGPNGVLQNLRQHLATLAFIASSGKPFEPNIPHHFAFRGGDDVTYVLSGVLAARVAKRAGVRHLVLQTMLNTPRRTSGVRDLAKARALLSLVNELADDRFRVYLQPRAGLDYFSVDLDFAKVQLAAVTALMDDIEPAVDRSPQVIHVVSYCEASHLAGPPEIVESIQITRQALADYRKLRKSGRVTDMSKDHEVAEFTAHLISEVRILLRAIHESVPDPYSAEGLHRIFAAGFLAAPGLWDGRDEFAQAVGWGTELVNGGVAVVAADGTVVSAAERAAVASEAAKAQGPLRPMTGRG